MVHGTSGQATPERVLARTQADQEPSAASALDTRYLISLKHEHTLKNQPLLTWFTRVPRLNDTFFTLANGMHLSRSVVLGYQVILRRLKGSDSPIDTTGSGRIHRYSSLGYFVIMCLLTGTTHDEQVPITEIYFSLDLLVRPLSK